MVIGGGEPRVDHRLGLHLCFFRSVLARRSQLQLGAHFPTQFKPRRGRVNL